MDRPEMLRIPANEVRLSKTDLQPVRPERHVVLVAPEIHWNTGNIGRTCLATGARLHLVKPLGFSLDSKEVKRAGLDYWEQVSLTVWNSFDELIHAQRPNDEEMAVFTKTGARLFWTLPRPQRMFLIFGSETRGLPEPILTRYAASAYHIPIMDCTRSLNLSTAAAIALYESLRHAPAFHAWSPAKKAAR
jgi:tRNA (cytidine/uridine-2'-O-)-methyltransferase